MRRPATVLSAIAITSTLVVATFAGPAVAGPSAKRESSATALLSELTVRAESHAATYDRDRFRHWVDANRDGEDSRAEVLKAESVGAFALDRHGTVKSGRWRSRYDGTVMTVPSKLDVDHMVALSEAWQSGAHGWSSKRRAAFANDLGYGPSLIAVTQQTNRSKGDDDPSEWMPPLESYRCTYVRHWIAVKHRWKLSVNRGERSALAADLGTYCAGDDSVATPGKPNVAALAGSKAGSVGSSGGFPSGGGTGGGGSAYYENCTAAREAGAAPVRRGDPGYGRHLDRDGDGVGCE